MSPDPAPAKTSRVALIADACLMTAAAFAVLTLPGLVFVGLGWIQVTENGPADGLSTVLAGVTNLLGMATVVVGPAVTWWLHGRRFGGAAIAGAAAGLVAAVLAVGAFAVLAAGVGTALAPVTRSEFAAPLAMLGIAAAAFVAVIVSLDVDAVRDLAPRKSAHRLLDVARLVATVALLPFAAVAAWVSLAQPATGIGEAGIFALAAGLFGAVLVGVADVVVGYVERMRDRDQAAADA